MFRTSDIRHLVEATGVFCFVFLSAPTAWAQSQATLRELAKLDARLGDAEKVLTARDAKLASDRLIEWKLAPEKLSAEDRARLGRVQVYIALANGDAAAALEGAQAVLSEFPEDQATLEAAYLAACAAGDAQLGSDVLKKLAKLATGGQRRVLSQRRRWMRGVGKQAPEVVIRTEDVSEFSTARRGDRVLLIDFWNVLTPPEPDVIKALRDLHAEYRHDLHVEFVGVNADAESRVAAAKLFAQENGYVWKQRYEYAATDAPITHEAFHAGKPPWQVVIDTFGYVRAIGAADEPGFQYALRAVIAEAGGEYKVVAPRSRDGKQSERAAVQDEPKADESAKPTGELPSNPEAKAKLSRARLFKRTGKRTEAKRLLEEIVRDYPGTREAQEARELLELDFNP